MKVVFKVVVTTCVVFGLAGCSDMIVNKHYAKDASSIPAMRLPSGVRTTGIKADFPVPAVPSSAYKEPSLLPPTS